jgi:hypothetical protein
MGTSWGLGTWRRERRKIGHGDPLTHFPSPSGEAAEQQGSLAVYLMQKILEMR